MSSQLTNNAKALRLFFTDDVYLVKNEKQNASVELDSDAIELPQPKIVSSNVIEPNNQHSTVLPTMVEEPKLDFEKALNFTFLGSNEKQILILVNDKQNEVSTEQGRKLLRKLVTAMDLATKDFALVNYANYPSTNFTDLYTFFKCKIVLSFGVSAKELRLQEQQLHQLVTHQSTKLIFTKNLHDLEPDSASKKILWSSLQQIK